MDEPSSSVQPDTFARVLAELAALRQQIAEQQREITHLKTNQVQSLFTACNQQPQITSRPTRRRMLRKLAAGLTIGLAVTGASTIATKPQEVQARIAINPSSQI